MYAYKLELVYGNIQHKLSHKVSLDVNNTSALVIKDLDIYVYIILHIGNIRISNHYAASVWLQY